MVMTDDVLPTPVLAVVADHIGEPFDMSLLSTSNSRVWRVRAGTGVYVVKHLIDRSSTPETEVEVLRRLTRHIMFRQVIGMSRLPDGSAVILAEFVPGRLLADVLSAATPAEATAWARQLRAVLAAVNDIPVQGFGPVSQNLTAPCSTWSEFLLGYLERQRAKAPALSAMRGDDLTRLLHASVYALDQATPAPVLLSADMNNRNFVLTERGLVCLNMPIFWAGDPASPYGEAVLHWAGTRGADLLTAECGVPHWRLHFYAAFHAYVILAYVERFDDTPLDEALAWGTDHRLLDMFDHHLAAAAASDDAERG